MRVREVLGTLPQLASRPIAPTVLMLAAAYLAIAGATIVTAPSDPGELTLLAQLPDQGSAAANWAQNERVLLKEMESGNPIRDASVDPKTGELANETGFLARERDLLRSNGGEYDKTTCLWSPGGGC